MSSEVHFLFVCCRWLFSWYGEGVLRLKHCWTAMQVMFVACTCEESVLTCLLYWDTADTSILAYKLLGGEGLETRLSRWKEDYSTDRLHFPLPSPSPLPLLSPPCSPYPLLPSFPPSSPSSSSLLLSIRYQGPVLLVRRCYDEMMSMWVATK